MSSVKMKASIANNERYTCSVPECDRKRYGVSRYCNKHNIIQSTHGSPTTQGLVIQGGKRRYKSQLDYTHQLIIKNADSKPVQAAIKLLHQWIIGCQGGLDLPGSRLLCLMNKEGKEPSILAELSAIYIYSQEIKRQSQQELIYALSNGLYKYIPTPYQTCISSTGKTYRKPTIKIGSRDRMAIGTHILQELGVFLENVKKHFVSTEQQHDSLKQDLVKSFD